MDMDKRLDNELTSHCSSYAYWFIPQSGSSHIWIVTRPANHELVGYIDELRSNEEIPADALAEFELYKQRPEYLLTQPVKDIESADQATLVHEYNIRLLGAYLVDLYHQGHVPDVWALCNHWYDNTISWLESTDFYSAPGSSQYHDSEPMGLLKHTLRVFNHTIGLINYKAFADVCIADAVTAALCHDWCKIGLYEMYNRNVKNDQTGKWEQVPSYRRNQRGLPLGHGATSMYIANRTMHINPDAAIAIRWHMGHWNVAENEVDELQLANETYPIVHLIQFADQLAITLYANPPYCVDDN